MCATKESVLDILIDIYQGPRLGINIIDINQHISNGTIIIEPREECARFSCLG